MTGDAIHRVRIYIGEQDRREGQPLYLAVLERLRREGATGASALRGLAGFGPGYRTRASAPGGLQERPPVVVEWVDRAERIGRIMPLLDDLLPDALITIEEVRVYRAVLRGSGRFPGERSIGAVARRAVRTSMPAASLADAVLALIESGQRTLPIVDDQGYVVGIVAEPELLQRAHLSLPLRLLSLLTPAERAAALASLTGRAVASAMNSAPPILRDSAAIPAALLMMIEWSYDQLPVVDRAGALLGLIGHEEVLRAALTAAPVPGGPVRDAEPPASVQLVMQTSVPQVLVTSPLDVALTRLLATPGRHLVVVDAAGRVEGYLSDAGALARLEGPDRAALLTALAQASAIGPIPGANCSLDQLLEREVAPLDLADSVNDAMHRLLELDLASTPVVDGDGRLCGLVTRGVLLRVLVQESV